MPKEPFVIQQDVLEFLRGIPDNSVDLAWTDPPYNVQLEGYANYDDDRSGDAYLQWTVDWAMEFLRIIKPTGSLCILNLPRNQIATCAALDAAGAWMRSWIVWNSIPRPINVAPQLAHHAIIHYVKDKSAKRFNVRKPHPTCHACGEYRFSFGESFRHPDGAIISDVWDDINRVKGKRKIDHPCQLPPALIERFILMTTEPGDLVIDPFTGAGSTGVAARQMGREFRGADISAEYVRIANTEIGQAVAQKDLFGEYISMQNGHPITCRCPNKNGSERSELIMAVVRAESKYNKAKGKAGRRDGETEKARLERLATHRAERIAAQEALSEYESRMMREGDQ